VSRGDGGDAINWKQTLRIKDDRQGVAAARTDAGKRREGDVGHERLH
jgi:hypothetical protein